MLLPTSQRPAGTATRQQQEAESTSVNGVTNSTTASSCISSILGSLLTVRNSRNYRLYAAQRLLAHSWVLRSAVFATQQEQPCQVHDHNAGWAV